MNFPVYERGTLNQQRTFLFKEAALVLNSSERRWGVPTEAQLLRASILHVETRVRKAMENGMTPVSDEPLAIFAATLQVAACAMRDLTNTLRAALADPAKFISEENAHV